MSRNTMYQLIRMSALAVSLLLSSVCFAHGGGGGWHGGGWHGGGWHGGGWHGGGWHGDGWNDSGWNGGGWNGGGWNGGGWNGGGWNGGWGTGVVIGVPGGYYDDCQTIRVCNAHGHCWLQDSCY